MWRVLLCGERGGALVLCLKTLAAFSDTMVCSLPAKYFQPRIRSAMDLLKRLGVASTAVAAWKLRA